MPLNCYAKLSTGSHIAWPGEYFSGLNLAPLRLLILSDSFLGFGAISSCLSGCPFLVSWIGSSFFIDPLNASYP